jgi:hypothetical protein
MLGGGNPVGGGNPSGTGTSLNFIGNHVYAYSGDVTVVAGTSADTTMLDFTTGPEYIVGTFSFTGQNTGSNDEFLSISMNSEPVFRGRYPSGSQRVNEQPTDLVIPPYTRVTCKLGVETSNQSMTFVLTGRVYN